MTAIYGASEIFEYGKKETDWLKSRDPALGEYMEKRGMLSEPVLSSAFAGLVWGICGQQISNMAHASIWKRVFDAISPLVPEHIMEKGPDFLTGLGLSRPKAGYILNIAEEFLKGKLSDALLFGLSDAEVYKLLCSYKGIGPWTAEMLLIFTLRRKNVLSFGDIAIKRGMCALYGKKEISKDLFADYYRLYSPFATIAAFYFWELAMEKKRGEHGI